MSGIEKELDPILHQFKKRREEIMDKIQKDQEAYIARSNEFRDLFKNIVYPVMVACVQYLESKGDEFNYSKIKIHQILPEIEFRIDYFSFKDTNRSAEITFSRKDNKVKILEQGYKSASKEMFLERSELTTDFVTKKLAEFIKSFLNVDDMNKI